MAFSSNTVPFSIKKISETLDPYLSAYPMQSFAVTCSPNIAIPSCSYAQQAMQNNYLSKQSVQKLSFIESIDKKIKDLLKRKLAYHIYMGKPSESFEYHCRIIVEELSNWMGQKILDTYNGLYRNRLMNLLADSVKQTIKDTPIDQSDWTKLLNQWIRNNSSDETIFSREIYQILAVDGFYGIRPKDLKKYLDRISIFLRPELRIHAKGVRAMYEFFDEKSTVKSLTGTDSACVVFLALLKIYMNERKEAFDDQIELQLQKAKYWAEGFLHRHSDYYRDVKNVNEETLTFLCHVYSQQFTQKNEMKIVGKELFKIILEQVF